MRFYRIFAKHINVENQYETLKFLESEEGLKLGEQVHTFYLKYLHGFLYKSSPKPEFNPLKGLMFKCGKKPSDIYVWLGKLSRSFIVSPKLKNIFDEFNLAGHACFDGVEIKKDKIEVLNYYYYSFYESMWDNVVIEKSLFYEYDSEFKKIGTTEYNFGSIEEYSAKSEMIDLEPSIIAFKNLDKYDLFPFFNYSEILYFMISERLAERLIKEKIKGLEIVEYSGKELFISV